MSNDDRLSQCETATSDKRGRESRLSRLRRELDAVKNTGDEKRIKELGLMINAMKGDTDTVEQR